MPMTVVSTVVPTARYMELPRADRKLPCSTDWKFFSVSGPPPPIVRLPWVLNAVTTNQTKGTRKMTPTTDMATDGTSALFLSVRGAVAISAFPPVSPGVGAGGCRRRPTRPR